MEFCCTQALWHDRRTARLDIQPLMKQLTEQLDEALSGGSNISLSQLRQGCVQDNGMPLEASYQASSSRHTGYARICSVSILSPALVFLHSPIRSALYQVRLSSGKCEIFIKHTYSANQCNNVISARVVLQHLLLRRAALFSGLADSCNPPQCSPKL